MKKIDRIRLSIAHTLIFWFISHPFKGSGRVTRFLVSTLIPHLSGSEQVVKTRYGYSVIVDPRKHQVVELAIFETGTYEAGTINIIRSCLREGDTFLDVGAHIGFISLAAAQKVGPKGKVYSFEAEPETFAILKKNLNINPQIKNVTVFNCAVGNENKQTTIYRGSGGNDGGRGEASLIKSESNSSGTTIGLLTIDHIVSKENIRDVKMMKIDVEGWELEVLKGASELLKKQNAPIICIEYSSFHEIHGGRPVHIYHFLTSINSYRIFKLEKGKERISGLIEVKSESELPNHDNIFCFLPCHEDILKSLT